MTNQSTSIKLEPELHAILKAIAKITRCRMYEIINKALKNEFDKMASEDPQMQVLFDFIKKSIKMEKP